MGREGGGEETDVEEDKQTHTTAHHHHLPVGVHQKRSKRASFFLKDVLAGGRGGVIGKKNICLRFFEKKSAPVQLEGGGGGGHDMACKELLRDVAG